jgi:hypothetical protein
MTDALNTNTTDTTTSNNNQILEIKYRIGKIPIRKNEK